MNVHQIVEAVLFASDAPLTPDEIARADEMLDEDQVEEALQFLTAEYDDADRAFQVVEVAEGYQVLTRPEFDPYLERFDNVPRPSRLSGPALETLAIIAYRQPIGRVEVEYIRGVGASGVIRTLQERRLIDVVGRGEGLGRPLLYGTTRFFLEHFGFRSMEDLPRPDELPVVLRERTPLGLDDDEDDESALEVSTEAGAASEDGTAVEEDVAEAEVAVEDEGMAAPEVVSEGEVDDDGSEDEVDDDGSEDEVDAAAAEGERETPVVPISADADTDRDADPS